jgi:beta-glucosidase
MSILFLVRWLLAALVAAVLAGCGAAEPATPSTPVATTAPAPDHLAPDAPVAARVAALLSRMSLAEKIGQMTQVEKNSITPEDVTAYFVGSVLSGGGGSPRPNTPEAWRAMVAAYQEAALATPLGIPLLYGVDAVHGHNNLRGATIFPHNIGLGATNDPALVEEIAAATAAELHATGVHWNFAPVVAVTQDVRWGRTYESYGEATALVSDLGAAFVRGTQGAGILATPKHFIGDGATAFGSSAAGGYLLDQGDARIDEAALRRVHLPPYQAALAAGARSVMASFSSWNGDKVHGSRYLLTDLLKDELGFDGFIVSDWQAIDQLPGDYYSDVVTAINAGVDMVMTPYDYRTFIATLTQAVERGDVSEERIDDAVSRILRVKFEQGLFEQPLAAEQDFALVGGAAHRALARTAVQRSLVLLKNEDVLPLAADAGLILVAGAAADDIGRQAGGWTIEWQGGSGAITEGTSILDGVRAAVAPTTRVEFDRFGRFEGVVDAAGAPLPAAACIGVVGEQPYAEGQGDRRTLNLADNERDLLARLRERCARLVVVIVSGRPLVITEELPQWDALVAAWLPGSEGGGVADALFGAAPFTGKLSFTWPASNEQLPINSSSDPAQGDPLFPLGFGLTTAP